MSAWRVPSARSRALPKTSVQRASWSFWRSFAGLSCHPGGTRPALRKCPELCVSGPVHAVSDTQASKRSPNIMANWLRAANHSRTFRPAVVALPFKLMLFVLADGWNLLIGSLAASFVT